MFVIRKIQNAQLTVGGRFWTLVGYVENQTRVVVGLG